MFSVGFVLAMTYLGFFQLTNNFWRVEHPKKTLFFELVFLFGATLMVASLAQFFWSVLP